MGDHPVIVGRAEQLDVLDRCISDLTTGCGRSLVVRGPQGIGKSALLDATILRCAPQVRVLQVCGIPGEAEIAFAGLSGLLGPLAERIHELPAAQAAAIAAAMAIGPPGAGDRLAVCVATLSLLRIAGRDAPVLAVVDDAQWLDAPSLECVRYAARRAEGRVTFVIAERVQDVAAAAGAQPGTDGIDVLDVPSLTLEQSVAVLARLFPGLSPSVAGTLARAADGNPLALIELPATLSDSQQAGAEPLPTPIMPGRRIQTLFSTRVESLTPQTQRALLVCALYQGEGVADLAAACHRVGTDLGELVAAEAVGLIRIEEQRIAFEHPLLRGAVARGAAPAERRAAHRALGETLGGARRAWHLAAAAVGPDDHVAAALEQAAVEALGRRGFASAARALHRAARLSTNGTAVTRRLLDAGRAAAGAGQPAWSLALLDEAATHATGAASRTTIQHLRGVCLLWSGKVNEAADLLTAVAEQLVVADPIAASTVFADAATARAATSEYLLAEALAERALVHAATADDLVRGHVLAVLGWVRMLRGSTTEAIAALDQADDLSHAVDPLTPAGQWTNFVLRCQAPIGRVHRALADGKALSARARDAGALAALSGSLVITADAAFRLGDWPAAEEASQEALEVCRDAGQEIWRGFALTYHARLLAAQGHGEESERSAREAIALAETTGLRAGLRYARSALGFLWLSMDRVMDAVDELEAIEHLIAGTGVGDVTGAPWAPDLVEAYLRADRHRDAGRVLEILARDAADGPVPAHALLARCRGMLASDFDVDFHVALACDDACPTPFERSRTLLAYGRRLRRAGRRADARRVLRDAVAGFGGLGAEAWRAQAERELGGTGGAVTRRAIHAGPAHDLPSALASLTPQERRVAAAVARGISNREIATMLFVSPKTVETHLTHIHAKLGAASRPQLVALLARVLHDGGPEDPNPPIGETTT